jgi:catechol 2,3-dioxygenase-like lactoylglutathione lyase family enzyme/uncharacterized protein YndB with AHSA1/START domain
MSALEVHPPLAQIALSVVDLRRSEAWYTDGLGFLPAGGGVVMMTGPIASRVQGLPRAASCAWWLVGRNRWFQFELFQFRRPIARLTPVDFRPCDIGYTRVGVHVLDFDSTLDRLARLGTDPLTPPVGERGRRRVCVRDPDGIYVEIMEDDPLPQPAGSERTSCQAAVRSVTLSTPDFESSVGYLSAISGRSPEIVALHSPEHEAAWGLARANCRRAVFPSGDILVEVVQYLDPVGKPRPPGYRICDQGILNIAYGTRTQAAHREICSRAQAFGARPNYKPLYFDGGGVVYMNDPLGFSVEIVAVPEGPKDLKYGFEPRPRDRRPLHDKVVVSGSARIAAPADVVWRVLCDHDSMSKWIGFPTVRRIRTGAPDPNGRGSERLMQGVAGTLVEQVSGIEPGRRIRYRVIEGGPVVFHNGEIVLRPSGADCEVEWTIRCRSRIPWTGWLLRPVLQRMMSRMLADGLKPYAERVARA